MQQYLNSPLPVRLRAMPGQADDHETRARHAVEAIRLRVALDLSAERAEQAWTASLRDRERATDELYALANGPAIAEYVPTMETSREDMLNLIASHRARPATYVPVTSLWHRIRGRRYARTS